MLLATPLDRLPHGRPLICFAVLLALPLLPGCPSPAPNNNGNVNVNGIANSNSANTNANSAANVNENLNFNAPPPSTDMALTRIVRSGDSVPGEASAATFTTFSDPIIDADGRVAFWAQYDNGNGNGGLFVWSEGTVINVIDDDPGQTGVVPGRSTADYFGDLVASSTLTDPLTLPLAWGIDALIFATPIAGESDSKGIFRWSPADATVARVVDLEQLTALFAAEFGQAVLDWTLQPLTVDDDNIVVFPARYTLLGTNVPGMIAFGTGLFRSTADGVAVVIDRFLSDPGVPGQPAAASFTTFDDIAAVNPAGDALIQAQYSNGQGTRGLYLARGSDLFVVLDNRPSGTWTGLPTGAAVGVSDALATAITTSDTRIVLDTQLTVSGAARDAVLSWSWARRRWTEVVGADASDAETLLTGVTNFGQFAYLADGRPHISNGVTVTRLDGTLPSPLNSGTLRWESAGSISTFGRVLLRYTRNPSSTADASAGLALWTGSSLIVVADRALAEPVDDLVAVSFARVPELDRPGRSGAINDADQVAFRITRAGADGQGGNADDVQELYLGDGE